MVMSKEFRAGLGLVRNCDSENLGIVRWKVQLSLPVAASVCEKLLKIIPDTEMDVQPRITDICYCLNKYVVMPGGWFEVHLRGGCRTSGFTSKYVMWLSKLVEQLEKHQADCGDAWLADYKYYENDDTFFAILCMRESTFESIVNKED